MKKDRRFEIQYIISLSLLILGAFTAPSLSKHIHPAIPIVFLGLAGLHIILFNLAYIFQKFSSFRSEKIKDITSYTDYTLIFLSSIFVYFIIYLVIGFLLPNNLSGKLKSYGLYVKYLLPLAGAVLYDYLILCKILLPIKRLEKIKIISEPSELTLTSIYEENKEVFLKIVNKTELQQEFEVSLDLPDDVIYKQNQNEGEKEFEKEVKIDPGAQKLYNIQLKYEGDERRNDYLDIKIKSITSEKGVYEDNIFCLMYPD